jgi:hypothetical protein
LTIAPQAAHCLRHREAELDNLELVALASVKKLPLHFLRNLLWRDGA